VSRGWCERDVMMEAEFASELLVVTFDPPAKLGEENV
jgi:hypothetical protein